MSGGPRVALVHDWLVGWGGSESVLASLASIFPEAPIFTLVHAPDGRVDEAFGSRRIRTTILQSVPWMRTHYPYLLPLMPWAWERVRLSEFDLVVSSAHAFCKSVDVGDTPHLCYCHTPPRYLWDLNQEYRRGASRLLRGPLLQWLRNRDRKGARGVQRFVANSKFVAERIRRVYDASARVVYPPVDVECFEPPAARAPRGETYFLAGGRLTPYKRVDLAVRAATRADVPLVVFGDGPERARLERLAGPTVRFTGFVDQAELIRLFRGCRAFLFPGVEDFGILPVEVQASGRPVIAFRKGGAMETVVEGETGVFFDEEEPEALAEAMREWGTRAWSVPACIRNAQRFTRERFEVEMREQVRNLLP